MHLDGSNAENKISLLVILCIIMYVKKKKSKPIFFFYITHYGKMLKYRGKISVNRYIGRSLVMICYDCESSSDLYDML